MELLEAACDNVAYDLDEVVYERGKVDSAAIDKMVADALASYNYNREQFDEMFKNIYLCDVNQYALNSADDARWDAENELVDDDGDFKNITSQEADALGVYVVSDNDL